MSKDLATRVMNMLNTHIRRMNPKHLAKASLDKVRARGYRGREPGIQLGTDIYTKRACSSTTRATQLLGSLQEHGCDWCSDDCCTTHLIEGMAIARVWT